MRRIRQADTTRRPLALAAHRRKLSSPRPLARVLLVAAVESREPWERLVFRPSIGDPPSAFDECVELQ